MPSLNQIPSLGRIVHVIVDDGSHIAAIITGINDDKSLSLTVFPPVAEVTFWINVFEGRNPGTYHWPEFVA